MGLQIIDQPRSVKAQLLGKLRGINDPGQIGGGDSPMQHGSGNAEAGQVHACARIAQKNGDDFTQAFVFTAGINLLLSKVETARFLAKESDPGVGPTDVTGYNHSGIFLQERPSRVMRSSASFGPQEPAG